MLYTILVFTPWVDNVNVSFYTGYLTIFIIVFHLAISLVLITLETISGIKLRCRKSFAKRKLKKQRKAIGEEIERTR